jgi:hypothetical protein
MPLIIKSCKSCHFLAGYFFKRMKKERKRKNIEGWCAEGAIPLRYSLFITACWIFLFGSGLSGLGQYDFFPVINGNIRTPVGF